MKFKTMDELRKWLTSTFNERMRKNAEDMLADGWTQEEVDAQLAAWNADGERCNRVVLAEVERIVSDPHAPTHKLQ